MDKTHAPLSVQDTELLDEYLSTILPQAHNTPRLFAIGFLGLPGTGKSTLADRISHDLALPLNRSDQIRRFLNTKGFPGASPRQDIMAALAEGRTRYFYKNKTSAVIDANFTEYAASSQANAQVFGANLLLIRTVCPDQAAIERLRVRSQSGSSGDSAVTDHDFADIKARVMSFPDVKDVYFEIDTTLDLAPQLGELYAKMRIDGYIK